jgi:hypothetical protein
VRRDGAARHGIEALQSVGYAPAPRWKTMTSVEGDGGLQGVFVWRALGREMYRRLLGHDLMPPHWRVRVASFTGDVAERAEEWNADVAADGSILRVRHRLPQGRPGASLDGSAARPLAQGEIRRHFGLDPALLKEVSAVSTKLPARLDWVFTYADTQPPRLARGERRLAVEIAGDRVVDSQRFVFVPEDWQRDYRKNEENLDLLGWFRLIAIAVAIVGAAALGILALTRRGFPAGFAGRFFAVFAVVGLASAFNSWPIVENRFQTAQPLGLQIATFAVVVTIGQLVTAALFAVIAGWCRQELAAPAPGIPEPSPLHGLALGGCAVGIMRLAGLPGVASGPQWGNYTAAQTFIPIAGEALSPVSLLLLRGCVLLAAFLLLHRVTRGWTVRRPLGVALGIVVGGLAVHPANAFQPMWWMAQAVGVGVAFTALYVLFLRFDLRVVPWMLVGIGILGVARTMLMRSHPDVMLGAALGAVLVIVIGRWWTSELSRPAGQHAAGGGGAGAPAPSPPPAA